MPIYLHPGLPPRAVYEAYYDGLPGTTGFRLSTSAWGWQSETAIHVMRLVLPVRSTAIPSSSSSSATWARGSPR